MKRRIVIFVTAVFALSVAANCLLGQNTSFNMKSAMSQQEYEASGIGTLRSDQQSVIDRWLNRWTSAAFGVSCGGTYPRRLSAYLHRSGRVGSGNDGGSDSI
jgi:hypothetical protein